MQQRPQRDRIIRPGAADQYDQRPKQQVPPPQPEEDEDEENNDELSQDELNEWFMRKIIRLENKRDRESELKPKQAPIMKQTTGQAQSTPIPIPKRKQPYEENYTQETPSDTPKKPKKNIGKLVALFVAIIVVAILLINIVGIAFLGYQLPF